MDDLDWKLLELLRRNARASGTDLAAALKVSRGTIQNRIDRLQHTDVIRRFTIELSEEARDRRVSAFSLIRVKVDDGQRVLASLKKIDGVTEVSTLSGPFDLAAEISAPSLGRLDHILDRIRAIEDVAETQSHIRLTTFPGA